MSFPFAVAIAVLTGFVSLSYEILWYRAFSFVSGGAPAVFGLLLAAFLLGLALGAVASRVFCRERRRTVGKSSFRTLAAFVLMANVGGFLVIPLLATAATRGHWAIAFPLVTLVAALLGAVFPLVSHLGIDPDELVGARLSYLYMANIIGSALGSVLTGFVLMDVLPLQAIGLVLALLGLGLASLLLGARRGWSLGLGLDLGVVGILAAAVLWATPRAYHHLFERLLYKEHYTEAHAFRDVVETRSGVVAVSHSGAVFGGGAYDGAVSTSLLDDRNGIVRAYAIAALHPHPRRVLMIGLATGAWAHVIAQMPGVESLTVIEINPGYLRLIAKYPQVAGLLRNPKARIVIDDGRRWLRRHPGERFDVVVSNTTWHWRAHTTNLLSREFLTLIRSHLQPGGIYHFNPTSSPDALYTAFTLFPYGVRLGHFATVSDAPIRVDGERWRRVLADYTLDGRPVFDLRQPEGRAGLERILATAGWGDAPAGDQDVFEPREAVLRELRAARIVTDDNMVPEWQRLFEKPWIPPGER